MKKIAYNAMVLREPYSGVELTVYQTLCALASYSSLPLKGYIPKLQRPVTESDSLTLSCWSWPHRSRVLRIAWEQTVLPVLLYRDQTPLLHAPAYVAPRWTPVPFVLTLHDLHVFTHPQLCTLANRLHYKALIPSSVKRAKRIITYSEYVKKEVQAMFPESVSKITLIPPGIDTTLQRCSIEEQAEILNPCLKLPQRFILFVGDLTLRKNPAGTIAALALIRRHIPAMELVLAGAYSPQMQAYIMQTAEQYEVAQFVSLPGYIAPKHLAALYSAAELLLFPTLDEGFGIPPIEAMRCGCPVVCSQGSMSTMHGRAVTGCNPLQPESIADAALQVLLDTEYREKQINRGYTHAAQFTWKRAVHALEKVYQEAIGVTDRLGL